MQRLGNKKYRWYWGMTFQKAGRAVLDPWVTTSTSHREAQPSQPPARELTAVPA